MISAENKAIERKRYFATQNFAENEQGYKKYIRLVAGGANEHDAREEVKSIFKWGDRRLDRVLETKAGAFSPKTASELEAKALVFIQRLDNSIGALCRHCDNQLDRLDDLDELDENGDPNWVSIEMIEESSNKDFKTRTKKMTVAEGKKVLLESKLGYNQKLLDGLKSLKVDTIININQGVDISDYSVDELKIMKERQDQIRKGREIDAEYEEVKE